MCGKIPALRAFLFQQSDKKKNGMSVGIIEFVHQKRDGQTKAVVVNRLNTCAELPGALN